MCKLQTWLSLRLTRLRADENSATRVPVLVELLPIPLPSASPSLAQLSLDSTDVAEPKSQPRLAYKSSITPGTNGTGFHLQTRRPGGKENLLVAARSTRTIIRYSTAQNIGRVRVTDSNKFSKSQPAIPTLKDCYQRVGGIDISFTY